jgi:Protein containing tetrapyrrole methyltransferase domain and MazG-like (predicted pyrophosphatase) domain
VHINPDDALEKTNRKFIRRFQYIEEQSQKIGKKLTDLSLEQMEEYWQQAKQLE